MYGGGLGPSVKKLTHNFIHLLIFATFLSKFEHIFSREVSGYFFPIQNSNFKPQVFHFSSNFRREK